MTGPALLRGFALLALLLGGCALQPAAPDREQTERAWQAHRASVGAIGAFELRARIAGSALGASAEVLWKQAADGSFAIRVAGPFGSGSLGLAGDPGQVQVTTAEGTTLTHDPEGWLQQRLGWALPLAGLRWWALGLPAPQSEAELELDDQGRLAALRQDGWQLSYDRYAPAGRWVLPRRLSASNGSASLRLVADQWLPETRP